MLLLAALAAIVLAQEVVPTAPSEVAPPVPQSAPPAGPPPPPAAGPLTGAPPGNLDAVPPLPTGPLLPVARSDRGETFLVVDRTSKTGDVADFWTFDVFAPAIEVGKGAYATQGLARHQIDCVKRTDQSVASAGYDEDGAAIVALAAGPPIPLADGGVFALIAKVVCTGEALPTDGRVQGHDAAVAAARTSPGA